MKGKITILKAHVPALRYSPLRVRNPERVGFKKPRSNSTRSELENTFKI